MRLWEILVCSDEHLLLLGLLGGDSLTIELICIKLYDSIVPAVNSTVWLVRVVLRLLLVLEVRGIFLSGRCTCLFVSRSSLHGRLFSEEWVCSRSLGRQLRMYNIRIRRAILPTTKLSLIHLVILLLQFPHLLNFVEVNDEACFEIMEIFDTFAAKYRRMFAAVEVLDALFVFLTHIRREVPLVGFVVLVHIWVRLQALLEVDARE